MLLERLRINKSNLVALLILASIILKLNNNLLKGNNIIVY